MAELEPTSQPLLIAPAWVLQTQEFSAAKCTKVTEMARHGTEKKLGFRHRTQGSTPNCSGNNVSTTDEYYRGVAPAKLGTFHVA